MATKPLEEPLKIWDSLTVQEKHNITDRIDNDGLHKAFETPGLI